MATEARHAHRHRRFAVDVCSQWQGSLGGGPFEVVVGVILAAIITVFGVMFILDVSVETVE